MALFTESDLRRKYQNKMRFEQRTFSNFVIAHRNKYTTFDIFLSHSFLDKELIGGLFFELTEMGYKVYVDWINDSDLSRANVTKDTCERIRNRMKQCKSLFYAISENATNSKWMPWELGYMDGKTAKCATIPITKISAKTTPNRQEYLSVYPYVIKSSPSYTGVKKLYIAESSNTYVLFDDWLKYNFQPKYKTLLLS